MAAIEITPIQLATKLLSINPDRDLVVLAIPSAHNLHIADIVFKLIQYPIELRANHYLRYGRYSQYPALIGSYHDRSTYPGSDTYYLSLEPLPLIKEL